MSDAVAYEQAIAAKVDIAVVNLVQVAIHAATELSAASDVVRVRARAYLQEKRDALEAGHEQQLAPHVAANWLRVYQLALEIVGTRP